MKTDFIMNGYHLTKVAFLSSTILFSQIVSGWTYPLKQVGVPQVECKGIHWTQLGPECKIELPIIDGAQYDKYASIGKYRAIYSDIWGGSYNDGWDNTEGGSPGIDIATPEGTPIYAIGDGEVIQASEISGYGKSVTVKHVVGNKVYYSSYSHMSKIEVSKGDKVKEGQKIGEVGKTGFTIGPYGYHLDFSISDATMRTYPYAYASCKSGYMSAVNDGTCREELFANTIDPIAFLEFQGDQDKIADFEQKLLTASKAVKQNAVATTVSKPITTPVIAPVLATNNTPKIIRNNKRVLSLPTSNTANSQNTVQENTPKEVVATSPAKTTTEQQTSNTVTVEKKLAGSTDVTPMDLDYKLARLQGNTQSTQEPTKVNVSKRVVDTSPAVGAGNKVNYSTSEIPVFRDGDLEIKISGLYQKEGSSWTKDKSAQVKVVVNTIGADGSKTPFDGKLTKPITFKSATSAVVAPYNYTIVEKSYMIIELSPITAGTDTLEVYYGDKLLGTYKINIK